MVSLVLLLAAVKASLELQLFDANGPKCIDGSPAGYYIDRGSRTDRYVAWIEGGGICQVRCVRGRT